MTLHDLNEKIHKKESELRDLHLKSEFNPENAQEDASHTLAQSTPWRDSKENFFTQHAREIRYAVIAICGIAFVMLSLFAFVRTQQSLFADDRVTVSISGPDNVNSADLTHFVISYENANRLNLKNAELVVSYPPGFRPEGNVNSFRNDAVSSTVTIGDISEFAKGTFNFSGKFYGAKNSIAYLRAELRYQPKNLDTKLSTSSQKSINLRSASLAIEIEAPLTVSPQGEVNYLVQYENTSDATIPNIRLKASYPSGFTFTEADPKSAEGDAVWYIGSIAPGEQGKIRITGTLDGVPDEKKDFFVEFGAFQGDNSFLSYSSSERSTRIVAPPFDIRQTVNGDASEFANPGDSLYYTVQYSNESTIGLREVIVRVNLEGDVLDFSRLRPEGGAYDSERKVIVWKASDEKQLANLAPGESGSVRFSVPIRDDLLPETIASKNYRIKTIASIESPDVPNPVGANKIAATNTTWIKVNSRLFLDTQAYYKDGNIPNTGPIPPTIGKETTYTIHWRLSNTTNDITDTQVTANLPTGARWTGATFPNSETITYNERTNKIVWSVGNMTVGEGILSPKREVSFQVAIRPELNQFDREVSLLNVSTATAKDTYTGESLQSIVEEKTTALLEDTSLSSGDFRVVQGE